MSAVHTAQASLARAHVAGHGPDHVAQLIEQLHAGLGGRTASLVLFFASSSADAEAVAADVSAHFLDAETIGCSTAGEFSDLTTSTGTLSAVAFPAGVVVRAAAAVGDLSRGAEAGVAEAVTAVEDALGTSLRDLDPARYVGFVLVDGLHAQEELVNEQLGNAAPMLEFVGGSAGDDLAFKSTWVAANGDVSTQGVALVVCEVSVPFHVVKSCSFVPSGRTMTITKADLATRTVHEFDGRPAAQAYAEAVGVSPDALDATVWMRHPLGLIIDNQPWIRSPQALQPDGSITFFAQIIEGMEVSVMNATDLIGETAAALAAARAQVGGEMSGAVMFNCILRRLEIDDNSLHQPFTQIFEGTPTAGFHTYGESYLGHINQTLTGVVFGRG